MGKILGFYELWAYEQNKDYSTYDVYDRSDIYKMYYPRSGYAAYMRAGSGEDYQNYKTWMLYAPDETKPQYVEIFSCVNDDSSGASLYEGLKAGDPLPLYFGMYDNTRAVDKQLDLIPVEVGGDGNCLFLMNASQTEKVKVNDKEVQVVTFQSQITYGDISWENAIKNSSNRVEIIASMISGVYAYFILYPVLPFDPALTSPQNLFLQEKAGEIDNNLITQWNPETGSKILSWTDSANTINDASVETYCRTRLGTVDNTGKDHITVDGGDAGKYTPYTKLNVQTSGFQRWATDPLTTLNTSTSVKETYVDVNMRNRRSVTYGGDTWEFSGPNGGRRLYLARRPTLDKDGLSWVPDGMKINFTGNYFGQGSQTVRVTSVMCDGTEMLSKQYEETLVKDSTITIPTNYLKRPPKDGEEMTITVRVDSDLFAPQTNYSTFTDTLTYDEGNVDITPTVIEMDGMRYKIIVPRVGAKLWLSVDGVNTLQTPLATWDGTTTYELLAPFVTEWGIFTSWENDDKTLWGTDYTEMPYISIRAHAFTWDGGSLVIWLNKDEALQEAFSFTSQNDTFTLSGRSHDVVNYLTDGKKNYTSVTGEIKGYIVPWLENYGTTKESVERAVEQGHVVYRSPYGRVCNVAITDASVNTDVGITEVSVNIVEEDGAVSYTSVATLDA